MMRLKRIAFMLAVSAGFALVIGSCSDDGGDGPTGGGTIDKSPPKIASITATDSRHIEILFDARVDRATAEHISNYSFVESSDLKEDANADGAPAIPGQPVVVYSVVLGADDRTVIVATNPMIDATYDYSVGGVKDLNGNAMTSAAIDTFQGSDAEDNIAPQVTFISPAPGATGVGLGEPVIIQFDEPLYLSDLTAATTWTYGGGVVLYDIDVDEETSTHTLSPVSQLPPNTLFTVNIDSTVGDRDGNKIAARSWSFTTTGGTDNEPPSLDSTTPRDGQTNVSVDVNFQIRFSEPVTQGGNIDIIVTPSPGNGVDSWSADGRTLIFDPDEDLLDNQQYTILIPQGAVTDLAGNNLAESSVIRFTTGSSFAGGSISGTLSGDPGSVHASSPADAIVFVTTEPIFAENDDDDASIPAAVVVGSNGEYTLDGLEDGEYYPTSIKDSNGDGKIDPGLGDAVGAWGINLHPDTLETDQASVGVASSNETNIDFRLWDLSVISGYFRYVGTDYAGQHHDHYVYVGVFSTIGFDPDSIASTQPDYYVDSLHVFDQEFRIGDYEDPIAEGSYFIGAYLDVNGNGSYEPAVDPGGFYMSGSQLGEVTISGGSDAFGVQIFLDDPDEGAAATSAWGPPSAEQVERKLRGKRMMASLKKALAAAQNAK